MDFKALFTIVAVVLATNQIISNNQSTADFEVYKSNFGKTYVSDVEETYRRQVYNSNIEVINKHNSDLTQTYTMGINQFTDMTKEEFKATVLMPKRNTPSQEGRDDESPVNVSDVNWVTKGAVQKVKDQGQCGSCWAFSAAGSSESYKFISTGTLGDFSEQQLVSCDRTKGNDGCQGGSEYYGMQYYAANGICTEQSYPYEDSDGENHKCKESSCTKDSFTYTGYKSVKGISALKNSCNIQPTSVAVNAEKWNNYKSGIFSNCKSSSLDHAVLLVGYTDSYWLIKNSWATSWGEQGYIRLAPGNTCGLANDASHPSGAKSNYLISEDIYFSY